MNAYNPRVTPTAAATHEAEVPEVDVDTIADLPFHVTGRFQNPRLIGRCRADGIDALSSKEFFERVRDLSLGLGGFGRGRLDAPMSGHRLEGKVRRGELGAHRGGQAHRCRQHIRWRGGQRGEIMLARPAHRAPRR